MDLAAADGTAEPPVRDATFVQSLDRGLAVIRAFDAQNPRLNLSEVARATGLTRAAARRFLLTLVQLGYVRVEGGSSRSGRGCWNSVTPTCPGSRCPTSPSRTWSPWWAGWTSPRPSRCSTATTSSTWAACTPSGS
ncbi:helix-turn-helix domain-containing protein [Blastococcus brunescens]|uniref:Helix-turn-helix domain-containing protein n=1 Tax=Blastococcus brunescens TaxID=1564165 RepID=A0ABZ1B023_9ACTN|nr:helix-turn-helix domain-containing protein [Blastococcus sp. BMG 8361]WRL64162.1 helix-turn-helix domain-containing protein [Blastococcus sp. BMG 8361]